MIKYIASIFVAAALLTSGVAYADQDGSVALNKWVRGVPANDGTNAADLTATTERVQRNQTVYFLVANVSGTTETIQSGNLETCDETSATTGCASAPLFIASSTAMICLDVDLGAAAGSGVVFTPYICNDKDCLRTESVACTAMPSADGCREFCSADTYDSFNPGGSWVYVDASTDPGSGQSALVWITGN